MTLMLYRVQREDGRGPWRPGFSKYWIDENSTRPLQADVLSAFGLEWREKIPQGWHAGCACRSMAALLQWFTPVEQDRLWKLGYSPVAIKPDKIIVENADQVVFARKTPLNNGIVIMPWKATA